jgi:hypothetical protein
MEHQEELERPPREDWELPLSVREGWIPIKDWITPTTTFNEPTRRALREWLEHHYPHRVQIRPDSYSKLKTFLIQHSELLQPNGQWIYGTNEAQVLMSQVERSEMQQALLELLDFTLRSLCSGPDDKAAEQRLSLQSILQVARSNWRVGLLGTDEEGIDRYGLLRRASPVADRAALLAASGPKHRAGVHLRDAWANLYGLRPNPSHAYHEAVRAVESAAKATLAPDDKDTTLGKMMNNLRTGRNQFVVRLNGDEHNDPRDTVHNMMAMIWRSEVDRHGTDDPEIPINVSGDETEAAIFVAVTLVQFFQAGHITRKAAEAVG